MNPILIEKMRNMEEGELYYALFYDFVAKCYNRDAFESQSYKFVAIIDLDSLSWLNDTHGHRTGDTYLRQLAEQLKRDFGSENVFRLSGDEFAVTGENRSLMKKKLDHLQGILQYFSYGVSTKLTLADKALYRQKKQREQLGLRAAKAKQPPWYRKVGKVA